MTTPFTLRTTALAAVTLLSALSAITTQNAQAADKAATKAAGTYVTGDFHNHTTCSDGSLSIKKLIDKSVKTFGLDWFMVADHAAAARAIAPWPRIRSNLWRRLWA